MLLIVMLFAALSLCRADDYRTFTITTGTNATVAVVGYADSFTGEIDEFSVYTDAGVTGAVAIVAVDPYSENELVLATNSAVTDDVVWWPRIVAPAVGGATSLTVTNAATANDRFNAHGEKIRVTITDATATGSVFRVFIKIKN